MPLDLAQLLARKATVTVDYAGETVAVDYRPHALTAEVQARLQAASDAAAEDATGALEALLDVLPMLVDGWDVTEGGVTLPVDRATLRRVPLQFLGAIAAAVTQEIADPNRPATTAAPTPSSSGASRPALSALPPTGTDS